MKKLAALFILACFHLLPLPAQERFRKSAPVPDPLQDLKLPAVQTLRLTNGLTLSVVQRRNLPLMNLQLIIFAGESVSPDPLPGLATLTAEMISRGTAELSIDKIEERVEALGGTFQCNTSFEYSVFSLNFLESRFEQALEVLGLILLQPTFPERELTYLKMTNFYELLQKNRDPEHVAKRQLFRTLFRKHPFEKALFNEDLLKNISRKDVQSFYQKYYRPNNAQLVLTGNLSDQRASRNVSRYLQTWMPGEVPPISYQPPALEAEGKETVCFIDHPGTKDAILYLGQMIFPPSSPDIFPFLVLNQVLGGTPNSRLFMNLRESKGYAYYVFSELEFSTTAGMFIIRAKVRPDTLVPSLQEISREITRLSREKILTYEIEQAKSYVIGHYPLQLEGWDRFSFKAAQINAFFNLGEDHWNRFYENIATVDAARVSESAQKYLLTQPVTVICGDLNTLARRLWEINRVDVYDQKGNFLYTMSKGEKR